MRGYLPRLDFFKFDGIATNNKKSDEKNERNLDFAIAMAIIIVTERAKG